MRVCVVGLWHLGTVTAACLASAGHEVVGFDEDAAVVAKLASGSPPLFEPGLEDLVTAGLASGRLRFTNDPAAVTGAEVFWVAADTPVDEDDRADVDAVVTQVTRLFAYLETSALVLISSQLPVGTTRRLEDAFAVVSSGRAVSFACSPENLRLGKAIDAFTNPDRVVVGVRSQGDRDRLTQLFSPFVTPERLVWMRVESAEMTKHALNGWLAVSVAFINEIAAISEQTGADATEVARGLKSDSRIGAKAYLSPGDAIAGGTLARDVNYLSELGRSHDLSTPLLASVKPSHDAHRLWAQRSLVQSLKKVSGLTVAVWGLTYKPGTDTLRRSNAVELCRWLHAEGAAVRAHDPAIKRLPSDLSSSFELSETPVGAVTRASALIVATPCPEFRDVAAADVAARMARPLVLDAGGFLRDTLGREPAIEYLSVGKGRA